MNRPKGWRALARLVVMAGVLLAPVFFIVMFITVVHLLRSSFGWWAWTVPAATEGSFVFLYLLDVLLAWAGKPMGWLRWVPYPFAVVSLLLNVWAYWHNTPDLVGHAVVTCAFFVPLIAAERAVRSLAVSDDAVKLSAEAEAACRYARDLLRDRKGRLWRWDVPSLLKLQVLNGRLPADVTKTLPGGPASWEPAVRAFVIRGLVSGDWMRTEETLERRVIEASAGPKADASQPAVPARRGDSQRGGTKSGGGQAKVKRIITANPDLPRAEIARRAGVSESTVDRARRGMRPVLAAVPARGTGTAR